MSPISLVRGPCDSRDVLRRVNLGASYREAGLGPTYRKNNEAEVSPRRGLARSLRLAAWSRADV